MSDKTIDQIDRRVRSLYEKAQGCLERGQYDYAIEMFQNILTTEPGFLQARRALRGAEFKRISRRSGLGKFFGSVMGSVGGSPWLAKAAAIMGKNPEGAMAAAECAIAGGPMNVAAHRILAEAAERGDYLQTATFAMATASDISPNDIGILLDLARLYQQIKDGKSATECYERVLALKPGDSDAVRGLKDASAVETMAVNKWDEAKSYRDLIKNTHEAVTLEQQARVKRDESMVANLLHETYKKVQAEPDNFVYLREMAKLYLEVDDYDKAIHWLEYANEKCGGADVSLEKLLNETKNKKVERQIETATKQADASSDDPKLKQELQELKSRKKELEIHQQEMLVKRYPNDLDAHFELAMLYYQEKRIDQALKEFQTSANNPKLKVTATHHMGLCLMDKNMCDLAIPRFKAALAGCPVMNGMKKEILYDLGKAYELMGKEDDAIQQYKSIYEVDVSFKDVSRKIEEHYKKKSD